MKKLLLSLVALFAAGSVHADEAKSPLAALESLVGGVWTGPVPAPKDQPPLALEARFTWAENKRAIRFESAWVRGDKRRPYTSGFYAWNAVKQKLAIYYVDAGGSLVEGLITRDGEAFVNDLVSAEPDGKTELVQVRLTKVGDDVFTNEIFVQKDGGWSPFVTVRYERKK